MTPRRILFINYEYPPVGGGGGNAMRHIAREMARRGHAPFVLTAAQGRLPPIDVTDGVTVRRIPALRRRVERSSVAEMLAFMASSMFAAPGYARQWRVDAVIAFFTLPCGPTASLLKRTNRLPTIVALRGGDVPGFDPLTMKTYHALTGGAIKWLWHDADAVIANSEGLADMARAHDPRQKIGVIPQGADTAGIAAKTAYGARETVELLTVGRLAMHKGLDVLLAALAQLAPDLSWRLSIVGDGPEHAALGAQVSRLNLNGRVTFKGWAEREALPAIYRDADLFLLPSREEGMANVLMEAMCAGLPSIATRIAGSREAVIDGETGLLTPSEDAPALARALEALIRDPGLRERMGRAARARAEETYSWPVITDRWLDIAERIIQKQGA
ncbi:MAG: glycosyltransferase family 4 protein [Rhodospirillaceae bacterium]|nr:glycosyltransferase family 4 protein [Rhodospirillaceae bacterium]